MAQRQVQTNMAAAMTRAVVKAVSNGVNPGVAGRVVVKHAAKHNEVLPHMRPSQPRNRITADSAEYKNVGVVA